jgi:hypothetical protein
MKRATSPQGGVGVRLFIIIVLTLLWLFLGDEIEEHSSFLLLDILEARDSLRAHDDTSREWGV